MKRTLLNALLVAFISTGGPSFATAVPSTVQAVAKAEATVVADLGAAMAKWVRKTRRHMR